MMNRFAYLTIGGFGTALLLFAAMLWVRLGDAIFVEQLVAGFVNCF